MKNISQKLFVSKRDFFSSSPINAKDIIMIEISFRIRLKFFHSHPHLGKTIVHPSHLLSTIVLAVISVDQPGGYP